ncbi:hypothetical protein OAN43_01280, partial [Candidatus Pelagibacter sp.]|nr:hypothetical protein [Candidatus Pelagibacter sp.]
MKRLLAYLFIVLGLGLTFSVNAEAAKWCVSKDFVNINLKSWSGNCGNMYAPHFKQSFPSIEIGPTLHNLLDDKRGSIVDKRIKRLMKIRSKDKNGNSLYYDYLYDVRNDIYTKYKTQIAKTETTVKPKKKVKVAKAEPSQTQKVT